MRKNKILVNFSFLVLTSGLWSPIAARADTYHALCSENNCKITIDESGSSGPKGLIAKDKCI